MVGLRHGVFSKRMQFFSIASDDTAYIVRDIDETFTVKKKQYNLRKYSTPVEHVPEFMVKS